MTSFVLVIKKVTGTIEKIEKLFGISALAFMLLINIWGIVSRFFFNKPLIFVYELTILIGVWIFFVGMGLVFKMQSEIAVNFVVKLLPKRIQLLNEVIINLLVLVFAISISWLTWSYIPYTRMSSSVMSFALELPDEIYFYPVGVVGVSIFISFFERLLLSLNEFKNNFHNNKDEGRS